LGSTPLGRTDGSPLVSQSVTWAAAAMSSVSPLAMPRMLIWNCR